MSRLLIAVFILLIACEAPSEESAALQTQIAMVDSTKALRHIDVRIDTLMTGSIQDETTLTARLEAYQEIDLIASTSGKVRDFIKNGSAVRKGAYIYEIDGELYEKQYDAAKAARAFAEKNQTKWERDIQKYKALLVSKDISQDEYDRLELSWLQAQQQYRQALVQEEQAKLAYENARYLAPFSGVVGQLNLVRGQQITAGQTVGKLADLSTFKAVVSLSLDEARRFKSGDQARFTDGRVELDGVVESVSPVADQRTGSYLTKIRFPAKDRGLISGLYGKVTIQGETFDRVYAVHGDHLIFRENQYFLFRLKDGKTVKTPVQVTRRIGQMAIVTGDLNSGDQYVISSVGRLDGNIAVNVLNGEAQE